jgi:hypothetical protein
MALHRLWIFQASGLPKDATGATQKAIQRVLDQFGEVGEVVGLSQVSAPDPKTNGAIAVSTFLVYRVPSADTEFDFEG